MKWVFFFRETAYPFKVMKVLFECFSCLCMRRLVSDVGVFLVPRTFVIFGAMGLPMPQTHPAKVVLAVITLHMVTTTVLLDANITFWALNMKKKD